MNAELRRALGCRPEEVFYPAGMALATTEVWLSDDSVVKCTRGVGKLHAELRFYQESAPLLLARTARVLASCESPPAMRLTRLAGTIVASDPDLQRPDVYRRAGEVIAAFHRAPFADLDEISIDDALELRFEGWFPRFEAVVAPELSAAVSAHWLRRAPLEVTDRTRTHRDYSDRNWLWDDSAREPLGIIDFEQSRPDHPWMDLTRLWERDFHGRPDLRGAFLEGYGLPLDVFRHPDFRTLGLQHAIATVAWATETGDDEYAAVGGQALQRWLTGT